MLNLKNTLDGYLKNVEVIGNTIQDENNLANIRSVGDKVEGQELYKIPVVSCGKNILSEIWRDGRNGKVDTYCGFKLQLDVNKTYTISIKYKRTIPSTEDVLGAISPLVNPNEIKSKFPNKTYQTIFSRGVLHYSMIFSSNCMQDDGTCYLTIYPGNNATNLELYNSLVEGLIESIQIEEGTQATPYEPYKGDKLEILSPVQLEKVGDVADRIICKDGVWGVDKKVDAEVKNNVLVNTRTKSEFIPLPHDQQVKLRTFAGQTNVFFTTEIAGQIKAQVPKSLGATVNTHTEQIAELHNSLERVKKLEETTVSTIETESSFTTVDATSNGYFEDVKLEGKTLVNLIKFKDDVWKLSSSNSLIHRTTDVPNLQVGKQYTYVALNVPNTVTQMYLGDGNTNHVCFSWREFQPVYTFTNTVDVSLINRLVPHFKGNSGTVFTENEISNIQIILLEGDHTNNPPSYFEGLMSVGQDVEEVSVESRNSDETQSNKKSLLYYNPTTETWEKPILREWDTIEKHSDGKYYYHKRSGEVVLNGSESWNPGIGQNTTNRYQFSLNTIKKLSILLCDKFLQIDGGVDSEGISNHASSNILQLTLNKDKGDIRQWLHANNVTVVYQLAQEEVYECTNIDLMTYNGETNYIITSGVISPKSLLKVHNNISNVVKILQEKVSLLENTFIAGLKSVLSGDMYSLATILYPEDFEQNDNIEQDIMVIPE